MLYHLVQGCTTLYEVVQPFFTVVIPSAMLYNIVQGCTRFYNLVCGCTTLYMVVQPYIWLYNLIYGCTRLYNLAGVPRIHKGSYVSIFRALPSWKVVQLHVLQSVIQASLMKSKRTLELPERSLGDF